MGVLFKKGNNGRPKGSKNRLTNDVRQIFHKVYDETGAETMIVDKKTGEKRKMTGHEAMLTWARDNMTEFYRLYGKMIPATAEITGEIHEDFVDGLIFSEEIDKLVDGQAVVVDGEAVDVGKEDQKTLPSGGNGHDINPPDADVPQTGADLV